MVIATHADQALRLLDPPTDAERDVLGAFTYTQNPALLHTDATLLPRRPAVRASWNYQLSRCEPDHVAPRSLPGRNTNVTACAGAYHGWGFHEDGCRSGAAAARALGGAW